MKFQTVSAETLHHSLFSPAHIATFLHEALGRYGDQLHHISSCLGYALSGEAGKGGFIILAIDDAHALVGAAVVNKTGMSGYIPENILVYIAVSVSQRGRGTGAQLMEQVISQSEGDIALHVDADNPAHRLYERLGFEKKYLEMRLKKHP